MKVQSLYLESLLYLGVDLYNVDIKFIEDNWESPTLGACGVGWEVWLNGIEVSQFTYFQQIGGIFCEIISCELTYGLERIALHLQKKNDISMLLWDKKSSGFLLTYGDIYNQSEIDLCSYNFELIDINMLLSYFIFLENECSRLLHFFNVESAYEIVVKISHIFNLLDARSVLSTVERKNYISRIRKLSNCVAKIYYLQRESLYFPLIKV
jgi:glycyl-tRNA synthetase alpha chain